MKKIIFIVIDGLGDKPIPQLGNKTPLEAAEKPNLDWLAANGKSGLVLPFKFSWQKKPQSDSCHLALFGYDPEIYYLGRGPYEAAGINIKMEKGDVAFRANFATCDKDTKIIDRRASRISETQSLIKALDGMQIEGVKFLVKKSVGHRAVVIMRGGNLSPCISDCDPKATGVKIKKVMPKFTVLPKCKKEQFVGLRDAQFTADILNKFLRGAHKILDNHPFNKKRVRKGMLPANLLLVRGAGQFQEVPSFNESWGMKACCIAGGGLYKGIAKILGMNILNVKGANALSNTNLAGKITAAKNALHKYDFVFCHIKATDSLAEDGNFIGKKSFIEKIDQSL